MKVRHKDGREGFIFGDKIVPDFTYGFRYYDFTVRDYPITEGVKGSQLVAIEDYSHELRRKLFGENNPQKTLFD